MVKIEWKSSKRLPYSLKMTNSDASLSDLVDYAPDKRYLWVRRVMSLNIRMFEDLKRISVEVCSVND